MHRFHYLAVFILLTIHSCLPPAPEDLTNLDYTMNDPLYRKIKDFQDRRLSDSLYNYLRHSKAVYRMLSAQAFGSYQDSNAIEPLALLLKDPIEEVRQNAAYSLGQIGHIKAEKELINAFIPKDSLGPFQKTNELILEAIGKCGSDSTLNLICKISNYTNANIHLLNGQLLAIYRFGLRNKICNASVPILIEVLQNKAIGEKPKLIASHCLQRLKSLDIKNYYKEILNICYEEKNPLIRMGVVTALTRLKAPGITTDLTELYSRIQDTRVQCNLIKGLQNLPAGIASSLALKAIQNPSLHISTLGAEYFQKKGTEFDVDELLKLVNDGNLHWHPKSILYTSLIRLISPFKKFTKTALLIQLTREIQNANDPYKKAALITALENSPTYLNFILQIGEKEKEPVVINAITTTIQKMMQHPAIPKIYPGNKNYIYQLVTNFLNRQCNNSNVGSLAIMAEWFRTEKGLISKYFKPDSTLKIAQGRLKLPKEIETYNEIENTISQIRKVKYYPRQIDYNHPINWTILDQKKDTIYGEINTTKGKIEFELYTKVAPASVANFIQLIEEKFFVEKIIHRVVPNFVIQSGCPRGDGYGSLDYTIRSEVSPHLDYLQEGMIGMASAGPDTECSQFFITFSPTPHLDGRYSIFGRMTKGMDVLNLIYQGDKITEITLK